MTAVSNHSQFVVPRTAPVGFIIGPYDRISIDGRVYRHVQNSGQNVLLRPDDGSGLVEQFPMETLARLSAIGKIRHEIDFYLPAPLKVAKQSVVVNFSPTALPPSQRERFLLRRAIVMAAEELIAEGQMRNNDSDIAAKLELLRTRVPAFLAKQADVRAMEEKDRQTDNPPRRNRKGNMLELTVRLPHASTIRKMVNRYREDGEAGLCDSLTRSGNRTSSFRPEELVLLTQSVQKSYLTLERKSMEATVIDVSRAFQKANAQRTIEGLSPLRVPGRDAVRAHIKKLDQMSVMIARYGLEEAVKRLRAVTTGPEVARPLERVEMDEWKIDLFSILSSANLQSIFEDEFLEAAGLTGKKGRWWLVVAIDCRTRVILGMKLTCNPSTSSAQECLRMVLSDKGAWSDAVGAMTPWSQFGPPETLVTDNGPGFKAELFTTSCTDLGISLLRTIAGIPAMRGTIERFFRTASIKLTERLYGRSFSNVLEKGEHPSEKRACLDADDLAFALVRWIVDIYHNTPHEGLGGLTPLEQWDADMRDGNYPLRAAPDTRALRLAFGRKMTRHVSASGVVVMGIRYHAPILAASFAHGGSSIVDIRWDPENLGAIEAMIDNEWHEVPAVQERFVGVKLPTWIKVRRALRAQAEGRKTWNEAIVFKALDDIEALATSKAVANNLIETPLTEDQLQKIERSLFSGFQIGGPAPTRDTDDGLGRIITPREPDVEVAPRGRASRGQKASARKDGSVATEQKSPDRPPIAQPRPTDAETPSSPTTSAETTPKFKIHSPRT